MARVRGIFSLGGEDPNKYDFSMGTGRVGWKPNMQQQMQSPDEAKKENTDEEKRLLKIEEGGYRLTKGITDWSQAMTESVVKKTEGRGALRQGMQKAGVVRRQGERLLGQNKLAAGASGIDSSTGSAKLVEDTLTRNIESDASQQLLEGSLKNIKAKFEANQAKRAGQSALFGGILGAGSSFLSAYRQGK